MVQYGITETDIAKRLMDYGFHAPTMSFPVHESLMIEPTESEDKKMLDRMIDALIKIRGEIDDIASGKVDKDNNALKNAPHTARVVCSDKWDRPYSRESAAYPSIDTVENKFWPAVGRIDNVYVDSRLLLMWRIATVIATSSAPSRTSSCKFHEVSVLYCSVLAIVNNSLFFL